MSARTIDDIFTEFNRRLTGNGSCPTKGSLGECPAMDHIGLAKDGTDMWTLSVTIWDKDFNDSGLLVTWLKELGAEDVRVGHLLHDTLNYDVDGVCTLTGARNWDITIFTVGIDSGLDADYIDGGDPERSLTSVNNRALEDLFRWHRRVNPVTDEGTDYLNAAGWSDFDAIVQRLKRGAA